MDCTLLSLFYEGHANHYDKIAAIFDDGCSSSLTYVQINDDGQVIADGLRSLKVENHIVGCISEPNLCVPCIIIGILKASSAFFFIDLVDTIGDTLISILSKSHVKYILACDKTNTEEAFEKFGIICAPVGQTLELRCGRVNLFQLSQVESREYLFPNWELALVVQTSGTTTGFPRVIKVPHRSIVANINHFRDVYRVSSSDVIFVASPLTFDPSVVDMFLALASGASFLLVPEYVKMIPQKLTSVLTESNKVTMIQATPSLMRRFGTDVMRDVILGPDSSLRILGFGGERCPSVATLMAWKSPGNSTELYNVYGISEVSSWASIHRIELPDRTVDGGIGEVPLGEAFPGTVLVVYDENGRVVDEGEGQIFLGGVERICFVGWEDYDDVRRAPLKGTGDWVRVDRSGRIFFLSRIDDQIKRNGKRVSLRQIERVVSSTAPFVLDSKAIWDRKKDRLVLAAVVDQGSMVDEDGTIETIRRQLLACSSSSLLPDVIILIDNLPITSHGKLDKRKLFSMAESHLGARRATTPFLNSSTVIEMLNRIWKTHLGIDGEANGTDSFVAFGGNSIKAVVLCEEIQRSLGVTFPRLLDKVLNGTFDNVCHCLLSDVEGRDLGNLNEALHVNNNLARRAEVHESSSYIMISRGSNWMTPSNQNKLQMTGEMHGKQNRGSLLFSPLWKYDMHKCIDASPLITCFDRAWTVLIGSHSNVFAAIELESGMEKWISRTFDRIESSACSSHCGKYVFFGSYDRHLYCLDGKSGNLCWKFETNGMVKSSPVTDPLNKQVYCGSHDHSVYAVDIQTGLECWSLKPASGSIYSSVCLSVSPHQLYVGTLDGKLCALCPNSGQMIWSFDCGVPIFSSPCQVPGGICIGCVDGTLYCFNNDGTKLWHFKTEGPIFSSCCATELSSVADGKPSPLVLFGSHDFSVYCLCAVSGQLRWSRKLDSAVFSTPFVHRHVAYFCSTKGRLYALGVERGSVIGQFAFPGSVFSSPVVVGNKVLVGCRDNFLYCIEILQS